MFNKLVNMYINWIKGVDNTITETDFLTACYKVNIDPEDVKEVAIQYLMLIKK